MIDRGAIVRFACMKCQTIFDTDLFAVAMIRGRAQSLMNESPRCKVSSCRGRGNFVFATMPTMPFLLMVDDPDLMTPKWLYGVRPCDIDAPDEPLPPVPTFGEQGTRRRA